MACFLNSSLYCFPVPIFDTLLFLLLYFGCLDYVKFYYTPSTAVIANKTANSTFDLPMKGIDWNYYTDSLNVKVSGAVDFNNNLCTFTFKAVKPGITNVELQTKGTDDTWINTPVRITVDKDLSMNIAQTGTPSVISEKSTSQDNKSVKIQVQ